MDKYAKIMEDLQKEMSKEDKEELSKLTAKIIYLGIEIINSDMINKGLCDYELRYWFSIPESSTVMNDGEIDDNSKTTDGMVEIFKNYVYDVLALYLKSVYKEDPDEVNESIEYIKKNTKFYVKIRKGEVWTNEKVNEKIKLLHEKIEKASGFNEV